jgi:O-antigen/teichoic acid export membrane protein
MNPLKKLASEAGLYGLPSILGRLINYALVPLHTTVFFPDQFGDITELYAYMAFLNIAYTFGMETAFFRFSNKNKSVNYYNYSFSAVLLLSIVFSSLILLNAASLYNYFQINPNTRIIEILVAILFIDAIVAIPLAQLRLASKAKKFATVRMSSILLSVIFNYSFLWFFPLLADKGYIDWPNQYPMDVRFVFWANLLANAAMILLLFKDFLKIKIGWNNKIMLDLFAYSAPILLMGLAGMMVENFDKLVFEALLPADFYTKYTAEEAFGIYGATVKLSIFMALAVQAFRYAGEPFFFSTAADKNAPSLFAKVLYYFVWLSLIIWLGVSLNADLIGQLFLRGAVYREALYLVPILLFGKLLFGMYINISIWFKLTDRTVYGIYISVVGAIVIIAADLLLIPAFGYLGASIASVLGYGAMLLYGYFSGQKYYPIPYPIKKIVGNIFITALIIASYYMFKPANELINYILGMVLSAVFTLIVYLRERKHIFSDKE